MEFGPSPESHYANEPLPPPAHPSSGQHRVDTRREVIQGMP